MLNILSNIKIIDNTGAKSGIMIKKLIPKTSTKNSPAKIGDVISFSVRKTINQNKIKRKKVYKALIVRTKKTGNIIKKKEFVSNSLNKSDPCYSSFTSSLSTSFSNQSINEHTPFYSPYNFNNNFKSQKFGGHSIFWNDNAAILVKSSKNNKELIPIGTRIKGPICQSLKLQEGCLKIASIGLNI